MLAKTLTALAAVSLASAPVLAQSAAPLSVASSVRASADASEGSDLAGGGIAPLLFAAILVGGVLLATGVIFDDDDDANPVSP